MEKHIKINKTMPEKLKKSIAEQQEWIRKVQAGEMHDSVLRKYQN